MTEPSEAMKAMARRVYSQFIIDNTPGAGPEDVPKFDDNAHGVRIALAAIIETQRADAALLREIAGPLPHGVLNGEVWILHRCADAIRTGYHYGKDESHD